MSDEPPLITISDPNHPGSLVDVVGAPERAPVSRRTKVIAAVVALLLVSTAATTAAIRQRHRDQAADRAMLASLALEAVDSGGGSRFLFRNTGPSALTVLSGRIDREGYATTTYRATVNAGATSALLLPFGGPCPSQVPITGPSTVLFHVRDPRGHERDLRVDVRDHEVSQAILEQIQQTCGLYPPYDALFTDGFGASLQGKTLLVTVPLHNRGIRPQTVTSLATVDGLKLYVLNPLPLTVPGSPLGGVQSSTTLRVRVTVSSCASLRDPQGGIGSSLFQDGFGLEIGLDVAYLSGNEGYSRAVAKLADRVCGVASGPTAPTH